MARTAPLLRDLRAIAGRERVLAKGEASSLAVDGVAPAVAVSPGDSDRLAAILRYATDHELAVIPLGSRTMVGLGNVPGRYDIALDVSRLNAVLEHEPADMTVTCQTGVTLAALRSHLAASGQMVPFDPSLPENATVGGALAAAAAGPARFSCGTPRDFTIGMAVATADGRVVKAGGKVVKNVAGYDLCKLFVGSLGTLGVIVEATFKLLPLAKSERAVALGFAASADACAFALDVHRRGLALRSALLMNESAAAQTGRDTRGAYLLSVDLAGSQAAVERSATTVSAMARSSDVFAFKHGKAKAPPAPPTHLRCCLTTLPSHLPLLIGAVEGTGGDPAIVAEPIAGVLRVEWRDGDAEAQLLRLREVALGAGASPIVELCPLDLKRRIDVFGNLPPSFPLMRRVKEQFDPKRTLSPGRFLGRL